MSSTTSFMDDLLVYRIGYDNGSFLFAILIVLLRTGVSRLSFFNENLSTGKNCAYCTAKNFSKQKKKFNQCCWDGKLFLPVIEDFSVPREIIIYSVTQDFSKKYYKLEFAVRSSYQTRMTFLKVAWPQNTRWHDSTYFPFPCRGILCRSKQFLMNKFADDILGLNIEHRVFLKQVFLRVSCVHV